MKKILYFVVFTFLCFVGLNDVSADNICYYKNDDGKINLAVSVDGSGDGKAVLTKPFNKHDGFRENQDFLAQWNVKDVSSENTCKNYILFEMKSGSNKISAHSTRPTADNNAYVLQKYDFMSNASSCTYTGANYLSDDMKIKINVIKNGFNLVVYFNDDVSTLGDSTFKMTSYSDKLTYGMSNNFYSDFINHFNDKQGCPSLKTSTSTRSSTYFTASNESSDYSLIGDTHPDDFESKDVISFSFKFYKYGQRDVINFVISAYADGTEEMCLVRNDSEKDCKEPKGKETNFQTNIDGKITNFRLSAENKKLIFSYEDSNNPLTLKDPGEVYFNSVGNATLDMQVYEISKTKKGIAVSSEDESVLDGSKFKTLLYLLYPYLVEKGVSDERGVCIDGNGCTDKNDDDIIDGIPLSGWLRYVSQNSNNNDMSINVGNSFDYELETKIKDVANYCNKFYDSYYDFERTDNLNSDITNRMEECISFDEYYTWLVQQGYVRNLQGECGILSQDMIGVINWVLNIIKIAGPILAIVLGMLDFAKVMVAEDADKTFKEAGKKFMRRIIAAVLLLLTPMLLSLILNFALGGQDGYDTENPFCNMVDWSEVSE